MKQISVGIIGGAGYTGGELLRLLLQHPNVTIKFVNSLSHKGQSVYTVHPDLFPLTDLKFQEEQDLDEIDLLFFCGGHGRTQEFLDTHTVPKKLKIIDLSQDFRIQDDWVYGLPELYQTQIAESTRIANPGCFATAIQLGLIPLLAKGTWDDEPHVTAITGSTGAGQSPSATSHFSWRVNNLSVYKAFNHQHLIEINHHLKGVQPRYQGKLNFIPMRGSFSRGILASLHVRSKLSESAAQEIYQEFYHGQAFCKVVPFEPDLKQVVNTNYCYLNLQKHGDYLHVVTCIDNLLKGASGQAVQNMNLMFRLEPSTGLNLKPVIY